MELKDLIYEKEGHIAYVYINRPQALNSFTLDTLDEFYWVQDDLLADTNIRVVILAARGQAVFSRNRYLRAETGHSPVCKVRYIQKLQEYYNRWEKLPSRLSLRFTPPASAGR